VSAGLPDFWIADLVKRDKTPELWKVMTIEILR
jgi:hypothetical protein